MSVGRLLRSATVVIGAPVIPEPGRVVDARDHEISTAAAAAVVGDTQKRDFFDSARQPPLPQKEAVTIPQQPCNCCKNSPLGVCVK